MKSTAEMLFERYETPLLDMDQLADLLRFKDRASLISAISAETCRVPTFKEGKNRFAHVAEVAKYLDAAASRDAAA